MTSPTHGDIQRDIGGLETGLEALKDAMEKGFQRQTEDVREVKRELVDIRKDIAELKLAESQRKGALAAIVSGGGVIGGAVWALIQHLWK